MFEVPVSIEFICDADLRASKGWQELACEVTTADMAELYEVFERRKAALLGGR
ncbi:hypothetical protein KQR54_18900 [Mycobacterium gordonae]|nr:hypothetical protein [Mycobacterium gordonae]